MLLRCVRVTLPLALVISALLLVSATRRLEAFCRSPFPLTRAVPYNPRFAGDSVEAAELAERIARGAVPVPFAFRSGDTLSGVLEDLGLRPGEALAAADSAARLLDLRKIRAGDPYTAYYSQAGLTCFELVVEREEERGRLRLARGETDWSSSWHPFERSVATRSVQGELTATLEGAVRAAGGAATLAYRMADVLQWDLDFNRDLRVGDRFQAVYEEVYLDGRLDSVGNVLALVYENRGRRFEAFRYGDDGGYYDGDGHPLRKMFLRSPLRYSRVTSRFSRRRFHPVLKTYRPHYGVDYGAPVGTPVEVTANGTVTFAGWDRGGGRTIKVRHPNGYITAYLHLSRFASGIAPGRPVRQGEVIGYVGSTGLATGPHLDYRVRYNGQWIDPLTIKSVPAEPIPGDEMPAFRRWRDALRRSLEEGTPPPPAPEPQRLAAHPVASALTAGVGSLGR